MMRIVKTIVLATVLATGGSAAFAQGRSTEADQAQGIRQSALAFTDQMQDRGFFGMRGGFLGDTSPGARAADGRITTQSLANRPMPAARPGSINNREWLEQEAYRERRAHEASRMWR